MLAASLMTATPAEGPWPARVGLGASRVARLRRIASARPDFEHEGDPMDGGDKSDFDDNATVVGGSEAAQELENIAAGAIAGWPQQPNGPDAPSMTEGEDAAEIRRMTNEARIRAGRTPVDSEDPLAVVPKPGAVATPTQSDEEKLAAIRQMTNEARTRAGRPAARVVDEAPSASWQAAPITSPARSMDVAGAATVQPAVEARHVTRGPSRATLLAIVGAAVVLVVVGVIYFVNQGSDDTTAANQAVVADADSAADGVANSDGSSGAGDDAIAEPVAEPVAEPEPDAGSGTESGTVPAVPAESEPPVVIEPPGILLGTAGLGIVDFGAGTAETVDALTAQLGPFSFDSKWRALNHPGPGGAGYADRANNPTLTFFFPK